MFWNVKYIVTLVFGIIMFVYVVLLHECGGLLCGIAALHDFHPHSRVRHWDRLWSSLVKGEGIWSVVLALLYALPLTSGLRIKSAMTCGAHPPKFRNPVDTALKPV